MIIVASLRNVTVAASSCFCYCYIYCSSSSKNNNNSSSSSSSNNNKKTTTAAAVILIIAIFDCFCCFCSCEVLSPLTRPGRAHLPLVSLVHPCPHLPLHLRHLLRVSPGRRAHPEDERGPGVVEDVVHEGDRQKEEHEDPAVVHDDVLQEGRVLGCRPWRRHGGGWRATARVPKAILSPPDT